METNEIKETKRGTRKPRAKRATAAEGDENAIFIGTLNAAFAKRETSDVGSCTGYTAREVTVNPIVSCCLRQMSVLALAVRPALHPIADSGRVATLQPAELRVSIHPNVVVEALGAI